MAPPSSSGSFLQHEVPRSFFNETLLARFPLNLAHKMKVQHGSSNYPGHGQAVSVTLTAPARGLAEPQPSYAGGNPALSNTSKPKKVGQIYVWRILEHGYKRTALTEEEEAFDDAGAGLIFPCVRHAGNT